MRIAYITPYQGPSLVTKRPIVKNRSVSNKIKIELVAQLLRARGHEIEILSHGEVVENGLKFYPGFRETDLFNDSIPIYYLSSLAVRRINGFWAGWQAIRFLKKRHRTRPFDVVIIFNLKAPQISCARWCARHLGPPVILQYEDDVFVSACNEVTIGWISGYHRLRYKKALSSVAGGMAVSPHLLSQLPPAMPKVLLRGVIGDDVLEAERRGTEKQNAVLFAGTHIEANGVEELIKGWKIARIPNWELHITGFGSLTEELKTMAKTDSSIFFHGMVSRHELVQRLCSAKICINPHVVTAAPGSVFAFKIIEYLAAGAHVITTPMGDLESALESGITYMPDNSPATIAETLKEVIGCQRYGHTAAEAAARFYGPETVAVALDQLIRQVVNERRSRPEPKLESSPTKRAAAVDMPQVADHMQ